MGIHAAVAADLLGSEELVRDTLADYPTAPLSDAEKALFGFVQKLNRQASAICPEDVSALKDHGWSEEAIYDAVTVCALFNFLNRWVDGTGVRPLAPAGCRVSARNLIDNGYVHKW